MAADTVEQIKAKLSILDVVQPYVKLTKAGRNYKGLSPFNKEKTPSFYVNIERNSYYCFSSSQGGDMFTFIEKMEGVDFKGALKILAEKAGVELVYERANKESAGKLDRLREAMARAEAYYASNLDPNGPAYAYALSRGLTPESIKQWNLGLAPDSWRTLLESLTASGYGLPELQAAGLVKEADGKKGTWYDRFRNRLMFPIRDSASRTVAFTGRALSADDQAKYLNSPETELYKKHEVLFGMDKAKDAIRTRGFAILVEGQMDLLMLHQIGFTNTIALSGTALSKEHLALVKRYADNLMLALDADRAGLAAAQKSAIAALQSGMRVKAVSLPAGKDPADIAKDDPKDFTARVSGAKPIVEFFVETLAASETDSHRLIIEAEKVVLPLLAAVQSPMEREHFIGTASRMLGISADAIKQGLARLPKESGIGGPIDAPQRAPAAPHAPRGKASGADTIALQVRAIAVNYPETELADRLKSEYARIIGAEFPDEPIPERILFEVGIAFGEAPEPDAADDLVRTLEKNVLGEALAEATLRLRRAESANDMDAIREAAQSCTDIAQRISAL
ncbi:MAG TPA: DNA primase [Candidatus Paceibacterota bacterium]|nr:DNA primase [Candidatus Paceibacterota bacterium]